MLIEATSCPLMNAGMYTICGDSYICMVISTVQTPVRVAKRMKEIFETAVNCQPAVVILDNLHNAMPHFQDVEEQTSGEGFLSLKKVQGMSLMWMSKWARCTVSFACNES